MPRPSNSIVLSPSKSTSAHPTSSARAIVRLELTPAAKRQNEAVADHFGMTQIATLSRLVEWFALQPSEVQSGILWAPEGVAGPAVERLILELIAGLGAHVTSP